MAVIFHSMIHFAVVTRDCEQSLILHSQLAFLWLKKNTGTGMLDVSMAINVLGTSWLNGQWHLDNCHVLRVVLWFESG